MAANDAYSQQALGADQNFRWRVQGALSKVAWSVLNEADTVPGHNARAQYARTVINNLELSASQVAPWLVERPNLISFETSFNFPSRSVVTAAGDADIESQLTTDWDALAGVVPGP